MSDASRANGPSFDPAKVPSLDIVYEQAQRVIDLTLDHADALDAKAGILVTAGSFVITGVAGLQIVAQSNPATPGIHELIQALAFLALLTYLTEVTFACRAFLARQYGSAPDPNVLYREMLTWHPAQTKAKITQDILIEYDRNAATLKEKEIEVTRAIAAFVSESVILGIILVIIVVTIGA